MKHVRRHRKLRRYPRVAPPESVYLISPTTAALALGISKPTLARWRAMWKRDGIAPGPSPIYITPRICKYRADECFNFGSTFLERMKATTASVGVNTSTAIAGTQQ